MITQKELKKHLIYDQYTGLFTRRLSGEIANCINNRGYVHIRVKGRKYLGHRLAWLYMTGKWPENQIDHINHVKWDNRFRNLRESTSTENNKNASIRKKSKTGIYGVLHDKPKWKYRSQIKVNGKNIHLGRLNDFFEACCARKSAERKYNFHPNHGAIK